MKMIFFLGSVALCLILKNSEVIAGSGCTDYQGDAVSEGETYLPFIDGCITCTCFNGTAQACKSRLCNIDCVGEYEMEEGACCSYTCKCRAANGTSVYPGDIYTPVGGNLCRICMCGRDGTPGFCGRKRCKIPNCPPPKRLTTNPNVCCGHRCVDPD